MLIKRRGGEGGGGGFIEVEVAARLEELIIMVGKGGSAGVFGKMLKALTSRGRGRGV